MMFLGSYYGDWNNESNFLRAPLGSSSYTLASIYAGFPHLFLHSMALGETLGHGVRLSQNHGPDGPYRPIDRMSRHVHLALMGDPTLRLHPVRPARTLRASSSAGAVQLEWDPSLDGGVRGYHVYRGASMAGPFVRVTGSNPVTQSHFQDSPPAGTHTYMVRAIKLEQSGTGTYFNSSQGIFATAVVSGSGVRAPAAPGNLRATVISSAAIQLVWEDNSQNETGFKIEQRRGGEGEFVEIGQAGADATTFISDTLSAGSDYVFRVRAVNGAGHSAYSNEAQARTPAASSAPPAIELSRFQEDRFYLQLRGEAGQPFTVEVSDDFQAWFPFQSGAFSGTTFDFYDYSVRNVPQRFYRVR
jgi:hypothetical protein